MNHYELSSMLVTDNVELLKNNTELINSLVYSGIPLIFHYNAINIYKFLINGNFKCNWMILEDEVNQDYVMKEVEPLKIKKSFVRRNKLELFKIYLDKFFKSEKINESELEDAEYEQKESYNYEVEISICDKILKYKNFDFILYILQNYKPNHIFLECLDRLHNFVDLGEPKCRKTLFAIKDLSLAPRVNDLVLEKKYDLEMKRKWLVENIDILKDNDAITIIASYLD